MAGGLIADTPGFSAFDAEKGGGEPLDKDTLAETFREFRPYLGQCRFVGCAHVKEAGCAVLEAVKAGKISPQPPPQLRSAVRPGQGQPALGKVLTLPNAPPVPSRHRLGADGCFSCPERRGTE